MKASNENTLVPTSIQGGIIKDMGLKGAPGEFQFLVGLCYYLFPHTRFLFIGVQMRAFMYCL